MLEVEGLQGFEGRGMRGGERVGGGSGLWKLRRALGDSQQEKSFLELAFPAALLSWEAGSSPTPHTHT